MWVNYHHPKLSKRMRYEIQNVNWNTQIKIDKKCKGCKIEKAVVNFFMRSSGDCAPARDIVSTYTKTFERTMKSVLPDMLGQYAPSIIISYLDHADYHNEIMEKLVSNSIETFQIIKHILIDYTSVVCIDGFSQREIMNLSEIISCNFPQLDDIQFDFTQYINEICIE